MSSTNIIKAAQGKRYWPHLQIHSLSRGGLRGHCQYPTDRVPPCEDLSLVPQHQTLHPVGKGFGVAACPCGSRLAPGAEELWHRHVPRGTGHATRQGRASVLPRVSRLQTHLSVREGSDVAMCHRAHHPTGKDSGVATCPVAQDPPPHAGGFWRHHVPPGPPLDRKGFGVTTCPTTLDQPPSVGGLHRSHVPPGPPPSREGLQCHHVPCGFRPASRCRRALASSCALCLSASEVCPCVLMAPDIKLIMASLGTQSRQRIKRIQDKSYTTYD
jgi:hypothetical protein